MSMPDNAAEDLSTFIINIIKESLKYTNEDGYYN